MEKMNWFDKWFYKQSKKAWENKHKFEADQPMEASLDVPRITRAHRIDQHGLNFTVYTADGGTVIELRRYDHRKDDHEHKLFVIHDDSDLGKELDRIITMEALRR